MQRAGWCRWDISEFQENGNSDSDYYFSSMQSSRKVQDHSQCTEGVCVGGSVTLSSYRINHINAECPPGCRHIEAHGIVGIIKKKRVALIRWTADSATLDVIEYRSGIEMKLRLYLSRV